VNRKRGLAGYPLPQSCVALFTDAPVDVVAEIFGTGGASPVKTGINDERRNDYDLRSIENAVGEFPEQVGALMDNGGKYYKEQRRCYGDELAALKRSEILHDAVRVLFFHLLRFPNP
jgi:hypothetical protein